jgi:predicted ribosome quality control (RQC) complex YloA/Tae2 family protein
VPLRSGGAAFGSGGEGGEGGEKTWHVEEDDEDDELVEGVVDATYVHLVVEVMGRHSNLILVADDGRIMESAKHVSPQMSRVRPIRPRLPYTPPPPLEKLDPRRLTTTETVALLEYQPAGAALAQVLVRSLRAISPQLGREVAFRVTGDAGTTVAGLGAEGAAGLARETRALFEPLLTSAWAPRVYLDRETEEPVAFSPVPLGHLTATHDEEVEETISAAIERAREGSGAGLPVDHAQRRARLIQAIDGGRDRLRGRLASLAKQEAKATEAERLRTWGELIYAYLWQVQPGQAELVVDDQRIPLDPTMSGKQNAQEYFERYRKAQGAAGALPELQAKTEAELAYLDQLRTMVEQASGFAELAALAHEWEAHQPNLPSGQPGKGKPKKEPATRRPRPLLDPAGNAVYIGRSGRQNDLITFDLAGPDDTWLHARGVPGSHVVVRWRSPRAEEEPATIEAAAALAAYYSAARESGSVEVDVTRRKHVRKIKGAGPGMVTYRQERTIAVRPLAEDALKDTLAPSSPT